MTIAPVRHARARQRCRRCHWSHTLLQGALLRETIQPVRAAYKRGLRARRDQQSGGRFRPWLWPPWRLNPFPPNSCEYYAWHRGWVQRQCSDPLRCQRRGVGLVL